MQKQVCKTSTGFCTCDPEWSTCPNLECQRLKRYNASKSDAAPVPQYERGD